MLDNFTFTLYEIFGYVFPGTLALFGLLLLFWALFVPCVPLGVAAYQPGLVAWTAFVVAAYLLGHGVQAVGNFFFKDAETAALGNNGTIPQEIRKNATNLAAKLLGVAPEKLTPGWVFRTLDEYSVQNGEVGDRDMFVYRGNLFR